MSFVTPGGQVLDKMPVNEFVTEKGEFKPPNRKAGESKSSYNKRYKEAQLKSGLYPRWEYASTLGERTQKRKELGLRKTLNRQELQLTKMDEAMGTDREYSANIGRDRLLKNIERTKGQLKPFNTAQKDSELESQKAKLKQNVSTVEIGTINDKLAKQKFNKNLLSDSDAQLVSDSFNMSQSITGGDRLEGIGLAKNNFPGPAKPGDTDFDTSGESISGAEVKEKDGVATVEIPKKSWSDIKGMKRGRERDKLALEYYKDRGLDLQGKPGQNQREVVQDLYVDNRVYVKDKGWTSIENVEKGEELFHHGSGRGHNVTKGTY